VPVVGLQALEERHPLQGRERLLVGLRRLPEQVVAAVERLDAPERGPAVARQALSAPAPASTRRSAALNCVRRRKSASDENGRSPRAASIDCSAGPRTPRTVSIPRRTVVSASTRHFPSEDWTQTGRKRDAAAPAVLDEARRRIEPHRLAVQERRVERGRPVHLEPGARIRDQRKADGMRLGEPVEANEASDLIRYSTAGSLTPFLRNATVSVAFIRSSPLLGAREPDRPPELVGLGGAEAPSSIASRRICSWKTRPEVRSRMGLARCRGTSRAPPPRAA